MASPTASPSPTGPLEDVVHGTSGRPEVALTFHGQGPASMADDMLAICRAAGAAVTVFAVGQWVQENPELIRRVKAAGHDVGNHTWSHLDMPTMDEATATAEIVKGRDALAAVLGEAGPWFRPSATERSTPTIRAAAFAAGYERCISYDVDPEDFREPGAEVVRERVAATVRAGSIVSLHLGHQGTTEALPGILEDLAARGLRAVTLSTLLRD
ncbi:MAG TPA: polysaccharide deacetylase family protein [Phycicoccus sp.]|nr:polysaccharide deacetylase family protein [Phycicoccus sp.]